MNELINESLVTDKSVDIIKKAMQAPMDLTKSFIQPASATAGVQAYNLEPLALMYPIETPLRNMIERVVGGFNIQANWKVITKINVSNVRPGVSEGARGGVINHQLDEALAAFRGFGLENNVTFEADYASKGYADVKAMAVLSTLQALQIQEERAILGGNTSTAMGTTPTPSTATATTGGTIAAATYNVVCVALGLQAYLDLVGVNNGSIGEALDLSTAAVPGQITRNNAGGTTTAFGGGNAQQSAAASQATTGSTSTISATVTRVSGASGYAWFVGTAGNERLQAVTSINSMLITSLNGTSQLLSAIPGGAADRSTNAYEFDGLLTQCVKAGSNSTVIAQATGTAGTGTPLTADNAGGVVEFEQIFATMYNKWRISPDVIFLNTQELINLSKKVIAGSGAPLLTLISDIEKPTFIMGGNKVGSYLNKVTGKVVPIVVHPNMPPGTILFYTKKLPYVVGNISNTTRMLLRQDYYQLEWPLSARRYDYGVYFDGVLQHYAPFSMAMITNIGNG